MRIVLDTSALFYPRALRLLDPARPVILPAVVFLERARQLHRARRMAPEAFRDLVEASGWIVEPFGEAEALRSRAWRLDASQWKRLARDAMICGHVREADELWTANPRDFLALRLPPRQVIDVHQRPA